MTCCEGSRGVRRCPGIGLEIRPDDVAHLDKSEWGDLAGRVVCYEWCHRLSRTYWDITTGPGEAELLKLPDNVGIVKLWILRRVLKESGWWDWRSEKKRRLAGKRKWDWLKPWKPRER